LAAVVVAGHGAIGLCGFGSRCGGISAAGGGSSVEQLPPFGAKNRGNRGIISPPQHTTTGCIGGQGGAERAAKHSLRICVTRVYAEFLANLRACDEHPPKRRTAVAERAEWGEMIPVAEVNVWKAAVQVVALFDLDASIEAALRSDAALDEGDLENDRLWLRVMHAIDELQRRKRVEGEVIH
jgi:hypothetical protein